VQRLENPVRDYAWGSATDIPEFLGIPADGGPVAELWIGAHPDSPSLVVDDGKSETLTHEIAARPAAELGPQVISRFGPRLPFLLKAISAARPLSLQVHPNKQQAEQGYAAQQKNPDAPRDYTDDNHKPELICALRDGFTALCGFRPVRDSRDLLATLAVAGLAEISDRLEDADPAGGLRKAVTDLLTSDTDKAPLITAVREACDRVASSGGKWGPACAAYAMVADDYPADPGVLVALLLNYMDLAAGEAVFVGAGVPHCYLRGFGAELMASSDNVLRAGLTAKRVNVPELLKLLDFHPAEPAVLHPVPASMLEPGTQSVPESGTQTVGEAEGRAVEGSGPQVGEPGLVYPTPIDDFQLSRLDLSDHPTGLPPGRPQILLCITGAADLRDNSGRSISLSRGQSAYLSASDTGVTISGAGTTLKATVGL
jgi:mannose-6-phosphate isomerase